MAGMNSSVLTCNHVLSAAGSVGSTAHDAKKVSSSSSSATMGGGGHKVAMPVMRAQVEEQKPISSVVDGRRAAMMCFGGALLATALGASSASASVIDDYLEKSKANKELNDKKRLVTSGANFARAYTVQFGSCKFPFNFTGCQDLAKQKKVPFISDDLDLECQGKDKYKCGSNVFWKW